MDVTGLGGGGENKLCFGIVHISYRRALMLLSFFERGSLAERP